MGSTTPETLNSSSSLSLNSPTTGSDSSSPATTTSRKVLLQGNKTAGIRSTDFLCGLRKKLIKNPKKELRSDDDREQLIILIKAKDDQISSLTTALAEKNNEAQEFNDECLKRGEEIKSLKLKLIKAREYICEIQGTSSDNHDFKSSRTTSVYDPKRSDGPKPRYDKDYVSGHHTNSNPNAG